MLVILKIIALLLAIFYFPYQYHVNSNLPPPGPSTGLSVLFRALRLISKASFSFTSPL